MKVKTPDKRKLRVKTKMHHNIKTIFNVQCSFFMFIFCPTLLSLASLSNALTKLNIVSNLLSNHSLISGINNLIQTQTINIRRYHNTLKSKSIFG